MRRRRRSARRPRSPSPTASTCSAKTCRIRRPGEVYRLWLVSGDESHYVGEFVPNDAGVVALRVVVDGEFDDVVVSVEPAASEPTSPGSLAWQSPAPAAA